MTLIAEATSGYVRRSMAGRWICFVSSTATASFGEERLRPKRVGMRPVLMGKPWVVVANRRRARHSVDFPGITEHLRCRPAAGRQPPIWAVEGCDGTVTAPRIRFTSSFRCTGLQMRVASRQMRCAGLRCSVVFREGGVCVAERRARGGT